MFNIGGPEFALIIVLALVVVGPEQLPGLIRKAGQYAAQARQMSSTLRAEFMAATEPMQDSLKEFQQGMNEFQTGVTDLGNTVTEAADPKKWGAGTAEDPIVPRGFADGDSAQSAPGTEAAAASGTAAAASGKADPWAADRVQPITEPERPKKLKVTPPVNPWDPIYNEGDTPETATDQTEAAAQQLEQHSQLDADEEPA